MAKKSLPLMSGHRSTLFAVGTLVLSVVAATIVWQRPWLSPEDRMWNDLAARKGEHMHVIHKILVAGDPQRTKTASRAQFETVREGTQHKNPHFREGAYAAIAFLAREERFRAEALAILAEVKTESDPGIAKYYSHYAMLSRAPGWREALLSDMNNPELASRARRDLETGDQWWEGR